MSRDEYEPPLRIPVGAEVLADALDAHPDYRVLRRLRPLELRLARGGRREGLVGLALDVETTGLDHARDSVIELAMQRFLVAEDGRIVETGVMRSWLEQPPEPISRRVTELTGLTDADVAGRVIADGEATGMLLDASFVVAHNSRFDRAFVERRLPLGAGRPWVCSLSDIDWRAEGFEGRTLSALLGGIGIFYDAHRAHVDVSALIRLLAHPLASGSTVVGRLLDNARRPSWIVDVPDAPFSARDVLRTRGYRWDPLRRIWSASVADAALADEVAWAGIMLYGGRREPVCRRVDWTQRYAASD